MFRRLSYLLAIVVIGVALPRANAALVDLTLTQTDTTTGTGTVSGLINTAPFGGPGLLNFTGTLPSATVTQNDTNTGFTVPAGVVGFATTADGAISGIDNGVHVGVSGTVTLTAIDGADTWTIEAPLTLIGGTPLSYSYDVFDNSAENDETGAPTFAGWIGDNGGGHRHSGNNLDFVAGDDNFVASGSAGGLGGNGNGDGVGIGAGVRDGAFDGGPIFIDNVTLNVQVNAEEATLLVNGAAPTAPLAPSQAFDVLVDIGPEGQRVQAGHIGFPDPSDPLTPNNNNNGPEISQLPLAVGGGFIFLSIDDTNQAGADEGQIDWRDRGDSTNGAQDLVQLGEDFIKNNSGIIRLTMENLGAGDYELTSFHVDPDFTQSDQIDVLVDLGDGNGFQLLAVGTAGGAVGGENNLVTGDLLASSATFSFSTDGLNPVTIIFDGNPSGDDETPLNGFSLAFRPIVPEPTTALLGMMGLAVLGARRRRQA